MLRLTNEIVRTNISTNFVPQGVIILENTLTRPPAPHPGKIEYQLRPF
jgi:hypothetical protein